MLALLLLLSCDRSPPDPTRGRTELNDQGATSYFEGESTYALRYDQAADAVSVGDLDHAHAIYTELSTLEPDAPSPWVGLASVAMMRSDWDAAEQGYLRAHRAAPTATQPLLGLGSLDMELGRHADAQAHYAQAAALRPDLADAHLGIALACDAQSDAACVRTHGARFLELAPASQYAAGVRQMVDAAQP